MKLDNHDIREALARHFDVPTDLVTLRVADRSVSAEVKMHYPPQAAQEGRTPSPRWNRDGIIVEAGPRVPATPLFQEEPSE